MILTWRRYLIFFSIFMLTMLCPAAVAARYTTPTPATAYPSPATSEPTQVLIPVTAPEIFTGCAGTPLPAVNDDFEQRIVELTNALRASKGLPPLKRVDSLTQSARYHAADMNNDDYFSHNTFDRLNGNLREICSTWDRIEGFYTGWLALAENIAAGQRSPEMAMDGWINSPDHYHNIVSDQYTEIGAGYIAGDSTYRYYWVQNFGKKEGRYPLIIAGDAARTTKRDVAVFIHGDWQMMRLRVNGGSWTKWQPFLQQFTWTMPEVPGEYHFSAELSGPNGTVISSDSIRLVEQAPSQQTTFNNLWLGE